MKGINMKDNFKLDHQAIGDCYYDVYTNKRDGAPALLDKKQSSIC